jgi:hypothetical protein
MVMASKKNFKCNHCDEDVFFATERAMIAHYRDKHPDDAYGLWDAIGTTGDDFADKCIERMRENRQAERDMQGKFITSQQYDDLVAKHDALVRKLEIIRLTLG